MAVEVNWTDGALDDLVQIAEFISKDSIHYAKIQTERFFSGVRTLEQYPLYGKMMSEFSRTDLREILEGNYRIVYRVVSDSRVDILTIHHTRRIFPVDHFFEEEAVPYMPNETF